jgi:hypothetical protein
LKIPEAYMSGISASLKQAAANVLAILVQNLDSENIRCYESLDHIQMHTIDLVWIPVGFFTYPSPPDGPSSQKRGIDERSKPDICLLARPLQHRFRIHCHPIPPMQNKACP